MGVALAIALVALLVAHAAIVVTLARARQWLRAIGALAVPPLAPWWAWDRRGRARGLALAWVTALGAYALLALVGGAAGG